MKIKSEWKQINLEETTMASNLWHECSLEKEGNPSIYLLTGRSETYVNEDKKIRKCEIGSESASHLKEKVIMFVEETGTGKTTMINTLANYFLGIKWEENRRFKLIPDKDEEEQTSETKSKTKWISSYTFHQTKTLPYRVTLVDTPGFGDTGGKDSNDFVTGQIKEFFSTKGYGGIDHIDAVAFVVKASSVRLTDSQRSVFESVLVLFGKDIADNIFLFITHAEASEMSKNDAPVIQAANAVNLPVKGFCICNNIVLFYQKDNRQDRSAKRMDDLHETMWEEVMENLDKFFDELNYCVPRSISLSAQVLAERRYLEIIVEGLPDLITSSIVEMNILRKEKKVLKKYKAEMKNNKDFVYEVEEECTKEITLQDGKQATVCTKCIRTCHFPCKRDIFINIGGIRMCAAMRWFPEFRGCGVCLEHCAVSHHKLGSMKYEREIVTLTRTKMDMKKRYEIAKENMNNAEYVINIIKQNQVKAQKDIEMCVTRLRDCLARLDKIALRSDSLSLIGSLEALKKEQIRKMEPGWEERVMELDNIYKREKERLPLPIALKSDHHWGMGIGGSKWDAFKKWRPGGKKDQMKDEEEIL